jgi:hypothetical protein
VAQGNPCVGKVRRYNVTFGQAVLQATGAVREQSFSLE